MNGKWDMKRFTRIVKEQRHAGTLLTPVTSMTPDPPTKEYRQLPQRTGETYQ